MRIKTIAILFFLFACGSVSAGEVKSYESGNCIFSLHDYQLTKPAERAIIFGVNRIIDTYRDTFGFSYPERFTARVTLFSNKKLFHKYQKEKIGKVITDSGYYSPKYRETVVLNENNTKKTKDEKRMVEVVFHEANHLILQYHIPWVPGWLNEGLCEYFEGLDVFGDNRRIYLQKNKYSWLKKWAKEGFPIELEDYLGMSRDDWRNYKERNTNVAYTMGYSLVYFMMSRKSTEIVLKELLWEFKRQGKNANSIEVIDKYYRGGLQRLKRNWLKWIPRARPYRPLRALRKQEEKENKESDK